MKVSVIYEPTVWRVEFFDDPWFFVCEHPVTQQIKVTTFNGDETHLVDVCTDCGEGPL